MNNQERLAREWAQEKLAVEYDYPERVRGKELAAAEHILATTTPPTMADVEWDSGEHQGAGAIDSDGDVWVMIQDDGDYINCVGLDLNPVGAKRGELTPNGKRYELREVTDEPEHPEVLCTVEDYENAPVGTIVAGSGHYPITKTDRGTWMNSFISNGSNADMAVMPRTVLREGWGE